MLFVVPLDITYKASPNLLSNFMSISFVNSLGETTSAFRSTFSPITREQLTLFKALLRVIFDNLKFKSKGLNPAFKIAQNISIQISELSK